MSEAEVPTMRAREPSRRNRLLLRLLSSTGRRPAAVGALCWRDLQRTDDAGQLVMVGKQGQLRLVPLRVPIWEALQAFRGRLGGPLGPRQVERLVRAAARRAHLKHPVSLRLLRYARPRQ